MLSEKSELDLLREQISELMNLYENQRARSIDLNRQLKHTKSLLEEKEKQYADLNEKFDTFKLAKSIKKSESDDTESAKQRINRIVRDIDRCIALLNK